MSSAGRPAPRGTAVVLGAGTAVGGELLRLLALAGFRRVVACGRTPLRGDGPWRWHRLDLSSQDAPSELASLGPEVAVSAAPVFVAAPALAALVARTGCRVAACSSMSAVAKGTSPDPRERAVASRLREAESALLGADPGGQVTILRPTMIWGSGRDRNVGALVRFARRWRFLCAPGAPTGLRQPVHFTDVAASAVAAACAPVPAGGLLELGGGERLSATELVRRVAGACGVRCITLPAPAWRAAAGAAVRLRFVPAAGALSRLSRDQVADNAALTRVLGIEPRGFIAPADVA